MPPKALFRCPRRKFSLVAPSEAQFSPDRAEFGASGPRSNAARWGRRGKRFWHESIAGPPSQRPAVSRLPHSLVFPWGINAKAAAGQPFVDSSRAAQWRCDNTRPPPLPRRSTWRLDVYYATFLLVDVIGPPSAKFCRTVANFPQVDDLRFISPWAA